MAAGKGAAQATFEGLGVSDLRFALRSVGDLEAYDEFRIGDEVGGEWRGQVVGVSHEKNKDGVLIRKHVIAVEKGTIG